MHESEHSPGQARNLFHPKSKHDHARHHALHGLAAVGGVALGFLRQEIGQPGPGAGGPAGIEPGGRVKSTFLRGALYDNGNIVGPAQGKYLPRSEVALTR